MLQNLGSAPAPAPADGLIKETTTQAFVKDVIEESKRQPVLIDFWAPWCGPCKQLTPILEKVVRAAKGKVKLVKMNIDEHPAIPGQMGIQSIPAVIAFNYFEFCRPITASAIARRPISGVTSIPSKAWPMPIASQTQSSPVKLPNCSSAAAVAISTPTTIPT